MLETFNFKLLKYDFAQSYGIQSTPLSKRACALSFGLLPWQYDSGSFAEKLSLVLLCHTRKSSTQIIDLRAHIQLSLDYYTPLLHKPY